jgi:predicted ferric reductase
MEEDASVPACNASLPTKQIERSGKMNLGVAAFWAFVAVIVVASIWKKKHSETLRHETMRLLIERLIVLSNSVNTVFGAVGSFVRTPPGSWVAAACALLLIIFKRRQIFRLVW